MESCKQIVAVVVVVVREGTVLAIRRAAHRDAGAGLWEAVSGRVQPGEEPTSAARRELREETGLEARLVERPVDAYAARRGDEPMVVIVFRADWVAGDVQRSDEHDAHRWMTLGEFRGTSTLQRLALAVERALAAGDGAAG